jgi:nicotinic acid mononucleotide adenylyltransferase
MEALTNFPEIEVSSTLVKKRLQLGKEIVTLVDEAVWQYIKDNNLYQCH